MEQVAAPPAENAPARGNFLGTAVRMVVMWYLAKTFFGGGVSKAPADRSVMILPKFQKGIYLDMYVYLNEARYKSNFSDSSDLIWSVTDIPLPPSSVNQFTYMYSPSKSVQNNGSLYVHAVFTKSGNPIDPEDSFHDPTVVFAKSDPVILYHPERKVKTGINLLAPEERIMQSWDLGANIRAKPKEGAEGSEEDEKADSSTKKIVSYFKPNTTIEIVDDFTAYNADQIIPQVKEHLDIDVSKGEYYPIITFNNFWVLRDNLIPMNETVTEIPLHLTVGFASMWYWQILAQVEQSMKMQSSMGAIQDGEGDTLKRVLTEGNPIFLAITMTVSLLHSVFDVLAFKNDIGFWKGKKNVEGLSVRTIGINAGCQVVILLYLMDNDTSWLILFSSVLGLLIELWKITQAMDVSIDRSGTIPRIRFKDKSSYTSSKTDEYDAQAMKYLSYALYPLVLCYAIYALIYETHKSWYSWVVNSLVGAVYAFGFILMCPQLYLNYKLKSVAHMPWRQMTYKFLNTIIDDLFAFVIKMPWLHRLSVFRDDVIFLIYLYQRWVYRVDMKRANEFGYSAEENPDAVPAEIAGAPAAEGSAVEGSEVPLLKNSPEKKDKKEKKEKKKDI